MNFPLIIIAAVVILPIFWLMITYNKLVKLSFLCKNAWAQIDTELKRRYDLIPNLVETVKGYASYERQLLQDVTQARAKAVASTGTPAQQAKDENQLITSLSQLFGVVENYPVLKASQQFLKLQSELINTEDRIQAARRFYNGNVRDLNTLIQSFPSNIVAGIFGYGTREFFEIDDVKIRSAPQVKLN